MRTFLKGIALDLIKTKAFHIISIPVKSVVRVWCIRVILADVLSHCLESDTHLELDQSTTHLQLPAIRTRQRWWPAHSRKQGAQLFPASSYHTINIKHIQTGLFVTYKSDQDFLLCHIRSLQSMHKAQN